jgi:hypothetical protein
MGPYLNSNSSKGTSQTYRTCDMGVQGHIPLPFVYVACVFAIRLAGVLHAML